MKLTHMKARLRRLADKLMIPPPSAVGDDPPPAEFRAAVRDIADTFARLAGTPMTPTEICAALDTLDLDEELTRNVYGLVRSEPFQERLARRPRSAPDPRVMELKRRFAAARQQATDLPAIVAIVRRGEVSA